MTPKNAACGWRKPPETLSVDQPVDETDSTWTSNFDNEPSHYCIVHNLYVELVNLHQIVGSG